MTNAQESMMIESMKNIWGGEGMVYRYGDVDKENERHGTMVAVHEQWAPLVHGWLDDVRKWGRYTGVQLVGNKIRKGEAETLDIISCYSPAVGSVQYDLQEAKLIKNETLKELSGHAEDNNTDGTEKITCPWQALREDLGDVIKKEESEHVTIITIGDMNFTWNEASRRANGKENKLEGTAKVRSKDWKLWAKVNMKMVNVLSDLMEEVVPTFYRVNSQDVKT